MPTYEYECPNCGHNFEAFQSMSDDPLKDCPQCGKELRRLINGGGGIIFRGSGFYVTDKSKGGGKSAAPKTPEKSPGEKPAGNSGEKSPAGNSGKSAGDSGACASCPAAAASGGSCPSGKSAPEKAAG